MPGQPRLFLAEEVDQFTASQPEEARRRLGRLAASMDRDGDGGLAVAELAAWIHTVHKVGSLLTSTVTSIFSIGSHQERRGERVEDQEP